MIPDVLHYILGIIRAWIVNVMKFMVIKGIHEKYISFWNNKNIEIEEKYSGYYSVKDLTGKM